MSKNKPPVTAATRFLKRAGIMFTPHLYKYEERGGTAVSARELGVDEHLVVKTLVMEDEKRTPLIVLMHGDMEVSTKELARTIGVKTITPCAPDQAMKLTGYQVGGTSPFGMRNVIDIYMEKSISTLETIYINGGKRGFLISMNPEVVLDLLKPTLVEAGFKKS